jgi:hypothetical protein
MPQDLKYGAVTLERRTIPDDEGVVVFRYRDRQLPAALESYRDACVHGGSPQHHITGIDRALAAVRRWQRDNPDRVVTPTSDALLGPRQEQTT